jgi:hypothetical protein
VCPNIFQTSCNIDGVNIPLHGPNFCSPNLNHYLSYNLTHCGLMAYERIVRIFTFNISHSFHPEKFENKAKKLLLSAEYATTIMY